MRAGRELAEGPDPAAVLRRRLPPPAGAARVSDPGLGRHDLLHHDVVPPVVTEIVDVHDLRLFGRGDLSQGDGALVLPLRPVVIVVRCAELPAHRLERVQVIAMPVEGDLDDLMQQVQPHGTGNLDPPPDRRPGAVQAHLDPVHGGRGLLRQAGQLLDGDALAADERLLAELVQHLLHEGAAYRLL